MKSTYLQRHTNHISAYLRFISIILSNHFIIKTDNAANTLQLPNKFQNLMKTFSGTSSWMGETDGRANALRSNHLMKDIWLVTANDQGPRCINKRCFPVPSKANMAPRLLSRATRRMRNVIFNSQREHLPFHPFGSAMCQKTENTNRRCGGSCALCMFFSGVEGGSVSGEDYRGVGGVEHFCIL